MTNQEYIDQIRQNLLNGRSTFSFKKNDTYHLFLRVTVGRGEVLYRKMLDKAPTAENIQALASYNDFATITPGGMLYVAHHSAKDTDAISFYDSYKETQEHLASTLLPSLYSRVQPKTNISDEDRQICEDKGIYLARELTIRNKPIEYLYEVALKIGLYSYRGTSDQLYPETDHNLVLLEEKTAEEALQERFSKYKNKGFDKLILDIVKEHLRTLNLFF